jgi:hypothetical protein
LVNRFHVQPDVTVIPVEFGNEGLAWLRQIQTADHFTALQDQTSQGGAMYTV